MTGRVIIVTGANSGIGFEAAKHLCDGGNDVILACRSEEKGKAAVEKILQNNPNALATFMQVDLADLSSVRKFADDFHATGKKLHVLVNNAGLFLKMSSTDRQYTKDNFELTMGTNHLGPFLLTHLLLEDLKKTGGETGDSRIVMVTSSLHNPSGGRRRRNPLALLDLENFFLEKPDTYTGEQAYKNSKGAMVMTAYELARQLDGTGVTVNCMCPGFIPATDLGRHYAAPQRFMMRYLVSPFLKLMKVTRTLEHGCKMVVDMCINEIHKGETGKYFADFEAKESSEESRDEDKQKKVYELSARYCHLDGYEPLDAPTPPAPEEIVKTKSKKEKKEEKAEEKDEGTSVDQPGPSSEVKGDDTEKEKVDKTDEIKFADEDDKPAESETVSTDKVAESTDKTAESTDKTAESTDKTAESTDKPAESKIEEVVTVTKEEVVEVTETKGGEIKVEEKIEEKVQMEIQTTPEVAAQ